MFDIEYKGGNAVNITTKSTKVMIDPNVSVVGLKQYDTSGAVELGTEARFVVSNESAKLVVDGPGEYEVGDFSIRGTAVQRHIDAPEQGKASTVYRIVVDEVAIAVLGNVDAKLGDDVLESLGVVDILILPVGGGGYTLDATSAASVVRQIEPKAAIPVHYADSALTYEVPQDALSVFTGELGAPVEEVEGRFKVKALSTIPQTLTVLALKRS